VSEELLDLASRLAGEARKGEDLEAFVTHERNFSVKAYSGDVETVSSSEPRGAGVRAVTKGRVGFAYTTDLTAKGLKDLLSRARANARHSTPDDAVGLTPAWDGEVAEVPGLVDERLAATSPDDKAAFAVQLDKATSAADRRVRAVEEAFYGDSDTEVAFATSTGVSDRYRRTDTWCYSVAIAEEGDDTEVGFEFAIGRSLEDLDLDEVAKRAAGRAAEVLGADKIPSARMPVIFDPYTSGQFLGVVAAALTGEAVQKGRSLFAGKIGEEVAATSLTLIDDGRIEGAPGSAPWDAEGTPTQRTEVIESGVLTSFLYDLTSARREGRASTGNASRAGFKSPPGPSATNLAFDTTGESPDALLKRAGRALLVLNFHGVHSGANPVSGDFSVGATGLLIENGVPVRPVKEVTIAAPMLEILARIEAVADDRRWLPFGGSFGGATTLVSEMTVAGT
jgi:PmbA protein